MKKAEFIELFKTKAGYKTKVEAENALKAFEDAVTEVLVKGDEITFTGFVKFYTDTQKGKTGTVPGTTKKYSTKDKTVPKMKFGKSIKDAVAK